ncbi:MAG: hypothetical protein IJY91_06700 [Oscillospiraceae bacterium]|nr:hypothetical protein [Oscillospiraceae bacterium]
MDNNTSQELNPELEQDLSPIPEAVEPEPELEDLDLESIIREFREAEVPQEEQEETPAPAPEESAPVTGDTIRMDLSSLPKSAYQGAAPIEEEPEEPDPAPEKAEPFSDQWEPEYEQPMGEYIPPQPIIFHPQSRFRELKKKLVAGPERLYYKLSEKGTGKLQVLLFLSMLVALICIGATVLDHLGMVAQNRQKLMIFGQLLCMFLSALLGSYQLIEGLADLIRGRFSLNTLLIFSFILCCADGIMCLRELRVPCCAAFSLQVVFSLFDTLHRRRTELSQMDILRKATDLTSVRPADEMLDGKKVLVRDEGQVEDFMDSYCVPSTPSKIRSWYAVGALIAAVGVGITGILLQSLSFGIHVAAITLLAATPASFFICLSRPADVLQKRFHKLGTLLCGWEGICKAKGSLVFSVSHKDLFPAGTVKMNGVKFFGTRDPDEVVAYGTALILSDDNGLSPLFEQVLESRNCHHLTAQNVTLYNGGIGGEVRGEPVLVGSLSFLKEMNVEIPEGLRVCQAVCVAIDGTLCGLFAISYEKSRRAASGLGTLCSYRQIKTVVCDGDFLLTPSFLQAKFGINPNRIQFADAELRAALSKLEPDREGPAVVLSTQHDLASLAYGITGAQALRSASILGLVTHMAGGIIGIAIMLTLTILGASHLLTPMNVILYQLIWSIPGILLTEWPRLI